MRRFILCVTAICAIVQSGHLYAGVIEDVVRDAKLKNGILVLVKAGNADYDEAASAGVTVRGLETDSARVSELRERFHDRGCYGLVSVALFDGRTLPFIDSLVNIVADSSGRVGEKEMLRILAPGGRALIKKGSGWKSMVKPFPSHMGEWSQYLCNADNNGVARDSAGPPDRLQWTAGSRYGRVKVVMPSVTSLVTAGGRMFTVEDVATTESDVVKKKYVLLARDAFNGFELWRRPLKDWDKEGLGPVKVISVQLQRLLAAAGDRVYCADGYDGAVTVFDGATGDVVSVLDKSGNTREFALDDGVIYGIQGAAYAYKVNRSKTSVMDMKIEDVTLYAADAATGRRLWNVTIKGSAGGSEGYIGGTLAVKGGKLCYISRSKLVCLDRRTGKELWRRDYPFWSDMPRKSAFFLTYHTSPPTIVMSDDHIFVTELDRVKAYAAKDGALLWEADSIVNYTKTGDLFFADGLVWTSLLKGYEPATGELKREVKQSRVGPMCHPRCYRNRITHNYYINSLTGGTDLLGLDGKSEYPSPWMRATCGLATTPSYGRLYSSPYVCACEIGSMLLGFNCTYTETRDKGEVMQIKPKQVLIKGPAYGKRQETGGKEQGGESWSTYRGSNTRSGVADAAVPQQMKTAWKASLPGEPTAVVVADGMLLTAVRDRHTVYALDSRTGNQKWKFIADGPVDSPPTIYRGLAIFGCRAGWVYCLDLQSGALAWKFTDTPSIRLMADRERIESAWPVNGSVMVKDGLVYFAAGRSSFLDGGITVYAVDPLTGAVKHRRTMAGPYDDNNFPIVQEGSTFRSEGFKSGVFSSEGGNLYIRHQGFKSDLSPIGPYDKRNEHIMASTGFLCSSPQHRTYWTVDTDLRYGPGKAYDSDGPHGDIMALDGDTYYEVRGHSPGRHAPREADPRKMYRIISGRRLPAGKKGKPIDRKKAGGNTVPRSNGWDRWERRWTTQVPIAGHAILLAGDTVVTAGVPMDSEFTDDDVEASYEGKKGGLLMTLSASDGSKTGELKLSAPPVWDGLAAADGFCYLPLRDGTVLCLGDKR